LAKSQLFTDGPANDIAYVNVRAATNAYTLKARKNCEELWDLFEPYADNEFQREIRDNFDVRYWEMYLTTFLMREGYEVCAPKPGPDVGIVFNGCRIWFEATSPARGADRNPDQVPKVKAVALGEEPIMQIVPNEKLVLRYLNSISEKIRQYQSWLARRVIALEDAFVIAINPRRLGHEVADTDPPRILQAAYPIGSRYIALDKETGRAVEAGYQFRDTIKRQNRAEQEQAAEVSTGVFMLDEYSMVSGLLCSRVDAVNQPDKTGTDFQLVENLKAKASLPDWFRLKGTFFRIERSGDHYSAVPDALEAASLRGIG
jgi:hypothetical protein